MLGGLESKYSIKNIKFENVVNIILNNITYV